MPGLWSTVAMVSTAQATPTVDLPARLRQGTWDLHQQTERTGLMAELLAGRITRPGYCSLLRNLHALYVALEAALWAMQADAAVVLLNAPTLQRAPALACDLQALHGDNWREQLAVLPATGAYVQRLQSLAGSASRALVAHAYVRYLGDLHGGQLLQRLVARSLGLAEGEATAFYDFGPPDTVQALRAALRSGLARMPLRAAEADLIVAEARWAFLQHQRLFEELRSA